MPPTPKNIKKVKKINKIKVTDYVIKGKFSKTSPEIKGIWERNSHKNVFFFLWRK